MAAAAALGNLQTLEDERILEHVRENEGALRSTLERLLDLPLGCDQRHFDEMERILRSVLTEACALL